VNGASCSVTGVNSPVTVTTFPMTFINT
jgi:hypothetical protein